MIRKRNINKINIRTESDLKKFKNNIEPIYEISFSIPYGSIDLSEITIPVYKFVFHYKYENNPFDIPNFVKYIEFYDFDYKLEELPTNIEHVIINKGFNYPVDNLGNNFKTIGFGSNFSYPIDNLPNSLEKVILGINFTHPLNNLPDGLKILILHNPKYDYSIISRLPSSLVLLQIGTDQDIELNLSELNFTSSLETNCGIEKGYAWPSQYLKNFYFYK